MAGGEHDRRSVAGGAKPAAPAAATRLAGEPAVLGDGAKGVWCADFRGWFHTADGHSLNPLPISDAHSRFLLDGRITASTGDRVRPLFELVFEKFGVPRAMRTDNAPPFASTDAGGLQHLAVRWSGSAF